LKTQRDNPQKEDQAHGAATNDGAKQVASAMTGCAVIICVLLLLGVIGALVVAQVQVVRVAARDIEIADLEEETEDLKRQLARADQQHSAELQRLSQELNPIPAFPDLPNPRPRLEVADPGSPDALAAQAVFTASSRVRASAPAAPELPFPEPELFDRRVGQLVPNAGGTGQLDRLDLPYPASSEQALRHRDYSPMTFDAGYEHAFIVDGETTLHKLDLQTFREVGQIELGAACSEVAMSSAGLVVGLHHLGRIWVIDPDTLAVRYELRLQYVEQVAASPALSTAWAIGKKEAIAFDVETGVVLNRVSVENSPSLSRDMRGRFGSGLYSFRVTADGRYAYTANRKLHQFAVDGTTLTYIGSTPGLSSGHMSQMSMSRDGQWLARPAGGGLAQGPYAIPLFRADELNEPALIIQTGAYPEAVDWDLTTGKIISQCSGEMLIFSPRGRIEQRLAQAGRGDVYQIAALPIGNRFILWTSDAIAIWDLETGRLAELLAEQ